MIGTPDGAGVLGHPARGVQSDRLAELFGLLSDQVRAEILYALRDGGETSLDDLSSGTGVPPTRLTEALRVLRNARVIDSRKTGEAVMFELRGEPVRRLLEVASVSSAGWRHWLKGLDTSRSA